MRCRCLLQPIIIIMKIDKSIKMMNDQQTILQEIRIRRLRGRNSWTFTSGFEPCNLVRRRWN